MKTKTHFTFRVDIWDTAPGYEAAVTARPADKITLRHNADELGLGATRGLANGCTLNLIFVSWPRRARGAQSFA
jgi:hypothetical protein